MAADNSLIKSAHKQQRFTEQDLEDIQKCMTDPHYFLDNFFFIQHPTKGRIQYKAFDYQVKLIDSYHNYRYNVNMLARQTGKTTTAAGYLLWYAMFVPDSTILIAAHKYTGAREIMSRIRYAYELCPDHIRAGATSYNKESLEFDNGSRIIAQTTTETTGRGMALSLLYCDEFAFVPPNIAVEFWTSISPTLSTGGKAIITSTPNSDEDQFAQIWKEANKREDDFGNTQDLGKNGFHPYMALWNEHPDRDEQWKLEEIARIGEERFRREHDCEFLIFDETLINSICLAGMEGKEPKMNMGQVRWYKDVNPDATFIVSLDPSLGTGGDYAGIEVIELPGFHQVAEWHHNLTPVQSQVKIMRDICKYLDDRCNDMGRSVSIYYSVENNSVGEAALVAINELGEESYPGVFLSEPMRKGHVRRFRKGFNTTHSSKISTCAKLKQLIESDTLKIYSKPLLSQLKAFVAKGLSFEAKIGEHDDLVSSLLLNIRMTMMLQDWDPSVYEKIHEHVNEDAILPMPIFIG